jgi:hypothetical protein
MAKNRRPRNLSQSLRRGTCLAAGVRNGGPGTLFVVADAKLDWRGA